MVLRLRILLSWRPIQRYRRSLKRPAPSAQSGRAIPATNAAFLWAMPPGSASDVERSLRLRLRRLLCQMIHGLAPNDLLQVVRAGGDANEWALDTPL